MQLKRGMAVRVKQLIPNVTNKSMPEVFVNSRKVGKEGTVDSPFYLLFNHHYLVKHDTSKLVRGVSVGYYGIYHEKELEIVERPVYKEPEDDYIPKSFGSDWSEDW